MRALLSNPIIIGAIITGSCALLAAIIGYFKKGTSSGRSASQSAALSRNTTQIQAGRDVHTAGFANEDDSKSKDQNSKG